MNFSEAVEYIQSFPDMERGTRGARGLTMSLDSMRSLLTRLGNPQNKVANTIHVTGSKGKGSTCAMLTSILHAAGYRTALYTSPHLHSYTERIALDETPITEALFASALTEIKPHLDAENQNGSGPLSTFGILTALFFHIASTAEPAIDWQIVEVGLGGRFDATNVMEQKKVVVITPISLEHIEVLGASQTEIANNKAAIITSGSTAILAPQKDASVRSVIGRQCNQVHATLLDVGTRAYSVKRGSMALDGQSFHLNGPMGALDLDMKMLGYHQMTNAATAAVAAQAIAKNGVAISDDQIKAGLMAARMPGRMELIESGASGPRVMLDGAHNHESAAALAESLKGLFPEQKLIFVIGVNNDKNINAIWRELNALSKIVITTRSRNLRALDPTAIADAVGFQATGAVRSTTSVSEAMDVALAEALPDEVICVTGSLYVVAEAREYIQERAARSAR